MTEPIGFDGLTYPTKDLPAVYADGDLIVYRASSFGNCPKELTAIRCGFTPAPFPERFQKIFADGNKGEDVIIAKMRDDGWVIERQQEQVNWEVIPGVVIRGHIDGVACHPRLTDGEWRIFDAKTTSKSGIKADLMKKYDLQVSIYGHALGLTAACLGVGTKDSNGDVVSVNIHNMGTLPVSRGDIIGRAWQIEQYAKHHFETGDYPNCDEKQYPCGAFQLHHGDGADADPYGGFFTPTLEDDSLDRYAAMYLEAAQAEAAAKDAKANARKFILDHIGGESNRTTDQHKIAWTGTGTKKELDRERLGRYLASLGPGAPKLDDFYGTKTVSRSISIKTIGDSE